MFGAMEFNFEVIIFMVGAIQEDLINQFCLGKDGKY